MSAQPRPTTRPAGVRPTARPGARQTAQPADRRLARLPWLIGGLIADFRDGLGMPRRAKINAIAMIAVAVTLSAWLGVEAWWARGLVLALGLIGIGYLGWFVPTREHVLARRRCGST